MKSCARFLLCVVVLTVFAGCGSGRVEKPTVKVDATLSLDGKPYGPARIALSAPSAEAGLPGGSGLAEANGSLKLWTYKEGGGVVPGTYAVMLVPDPMKVSEAVQAKPASVEIPKEGGKVEIKLETKPGTKGKLPSAI